MNVITKILRRWRMRRAAKAFATALDLGSDVSVRGFEEHFHSLGCSEDFIQRFLAASHAARAGKIPTLQETKLLIEGLVPLWIARGLVDPSRGAAFLSALQEGELGDELNH
jgi:hypothetical protein